MLSVKKLIDKIFRNKEGRIVLWQNPNAPLYGWIVFSIAERLIKNDDVHYILALASRLSLLVWAILEITKGVNYFRRILGLAVLIMLIINQIG